MKDIFLRTSLRLGAFAVALCGSLLAGSAWAQGSGGGFCPQDTPVCCEIMGKEFKDSRSCCRMKGGKETEKDPALCGKGGIKPPPGRCKAVSTCYSTPYGNVLSADSCPPLFDYAVGGKNWIRNVCSRDSDDPNAPRCTAVSIDRCR